MRDDEIQDALDRQAREAEHPSSGTADAADARDADRAAYAIVYAALAEDTGFTLPAAFAESIAAAAMPEPVRPWIVERAVLPFLLLISAVIGVPAAVPQLSRAFRLLLGAADGGVPPTVVAALVLLFIAAADRLARRGGWAPRT